LYIARNSAVREDLGAMNLSFPIIILGAGNLGRRLAQATRPELFCDNNSSMWGTVVDGIPVESPRTAVERYPDATFVVAIWHPSRTESMVDRIAQLKLLGARNVIPFTALLPELGDRLLPHLLWERPQYYAGHEEEITRARALLDAEGREEFDRQMKLRMGDHSGQVIDPGAQYFPTDLLQLSDNEVFVDCGAYDGDTIADFRRASNDRFERIIAFEPDPANFDSLQSTVNGDQRISLQPYATGARHETLRLSMAGTGSRISETGTCVIEAIALDEALTDMAPTYIKFDIEGSEPAALEGGRKTIARFRPKLAVCVYHAPDHLWSILLRVSELLPDSRFSLRTYAADGFECVCYCLPR
jgi:FkbM family methyltransferase